MHSHRLSTKLVAFSLPVAGVLMTAGALIDPGVDETTQTTYMRGLADRGAQDRYQVSALVLHFAFLAFVPALLGLWGLSKPGKLRATGIAFGLMGAATLPGLLLSDYYDIALARNLPAEQAAHIANVTQNLAGSQLLHIPALAGLVLGFATLFTAAVRAKAIPAKLPVLILAAIVAPALAGGGITAFLVSSAVLLIAFVLLGRQLLSASQSASPSATATKHAITMRPSRKAAA